MWMDPAPRWPLTQDGHTYIKVHAQIIVQSDNHHLPGVVSILPDDTLGILLRGTPTQRLQFKEHVGTPPWLWVTDAADYVRTPDIINIQTAHNTWQSPEQLLDYHQAQWGLMTVRSPEDWRLIQITPDGDSGEFITVRGSRPRQLRVTRQTIETLNFVPITINSQENYHSDVWFTPTTGYLVPLDHYPDVIRWQIQHNMTHPAHQVVHNNADGPPQLPPNLFITRLTGPQTTSSGAIAWAVDVSRGQDRVTLECHTSPDGHNTVYKRSLGEDWTLKITSGQYRWYKVSSSTHHPVRHLTPLEAHGVAAILASRYVGSPLSPTPTHDAQAKTLLAHVFEHSQDFAGGPCTPLRSAYQPLDATRP